jgi:hypothetical protein
MRRIFLLSTVIIVAAVFLLPIVLPAVAADSGNSSTCTAAGNTTLSAYMVITHSHTTVSWKTIDAKGCDIGIYVSPGLTDIVISHVSVTDANQHGILVQDDSHVSIQNNLVWGIGAKTRVCPPAGTPPPGCIPENKPIQLVGTSYADVSYNTVTHNSADGGIGVADDGSQNPGAPLGVSGASLRAMSDEVSWNKITDNLAGCGIVIAAYNSDVGVMNVNVSQNTIRGSSPSEVASGAPPYIGQIVVATDAPDATITGVQIKHNTLDGSFLPGIVLHANVFEDKILWTTIIGNTVGESGYYPGPGNSQSNTPTSAQGTTGISIVAENPTPQGTAPAVISHTQISYNTILESSIGVWLCYTQQTTVTHIDGNPSTPQATCAAGGS